MEILSELPRENARYPRLLLMDGTIHIRIGTDSFPWKLKPGEQVRLSRHGVFCVESATKEIAFLKITFPRKGWNPSGAKRCRVAVPVRCEVTIRKGAFHLRRVPLHEWKNLLEWEKGKQTYISRWSRHAYGGGRPIVRPADAAQT